MSYPDTPTLIERLVNFKPPNKEFGQHYLNDDEVLARAVELGNPTTGDIVLEIGSGPGSLTAHLLASGAKVVAIEVDPDSCTHLEEIFTDDLSSGALTLIQDDALEVKIPAEITHVIANIPYQISSPLIERLLKHHRSGRGLQVVVLLLQEEFAERLAMSEGPASFGPLGITTAFEWLVELDRIVHSHCFKPAPAIHSRLVRLSPLEEPHMLPNGITTPSVKFASMIVRECFTERRKKMRNRLNQTPRRIARAKGWYAKAYRAAAKAVIANEELLGLPTGWQEARPEQLSVMNWLVLASHIEAQKEA